MPEAVAMRLTGHKTRSVFDRYHIVSDSDLREAAQKLNAALKAGVGTKPAHLSRTIPPTKRSPFKFPRNLWCRRWELNPHSPKGTGF